MRRRIPLRRILRSRLLAAWLIVFIGLYVAAATSSSTSDNEASGLLRVFGLDHPFSHPVFLGAVALLVLSTAACAWERTRAAAKTMRAQGRVSASAISRLESRPATPVVSVDPLGSAETRLSALGMRTRSGPRVLEAHAGVWGLWGSPIFHWALVALIVVLALGRLTRAEGQIGVPVGGQRADEGEWYGTRDVGPWHRVSSDVVFEVVDFDPSYVDERGMDVGPAPVVQLRKNDIVVARQHVYPNRPLRHGRLMVHSTDGYGLSAWVSVETSAGAVVDSAQTLSDFDTAQATGTSRTELQIGSGVDRVFVAVSPRAQAETRDGRRYLLHELPEDPVLHVQVDASTSAPIVADLRPGEAADLPQGYRLRFQRLTYYARLSVADDWSVMPMYGLFLIAALGLSLAVFAPYRSVRVLLTKDGSGLHADWRHSRRDPLFGERVRAALQEAAGVSEPPDADKHTREEASSAR